MGYLVALSWPTGSMFAVLYGRDSWGNVCNRPNEAIENITLSGQDMTGLTKKFYMNPLALVRITETSAVICTKSCPQKTISNITGLQDFADTNDTRLCHYNIEPDSYPDQYNGPDSLPVRKPINTCPVMPIMEHLDVINVCTPKFLTDLASSSIEAAIASADTVSSLISPTCEKDGSFFDKAWEDLQATQTQIMYLSLVALGVAFVITILMGVIATIVIWLTFVAMALASIGATAYCWYLWYTKNHHLKNLPNDAEATESEKEDVHNWLIIAIVVSSVAFVILLVLLVMRKRIKLVAQLFVEASSAVRRMPLLLFQPFFTLITLIIILAGLAVGASYIMTSGELTVDDNGFVSYVPTTLFWYLRWAYLLWVLWWIEFVFACEEMVIAGAVSIWFFTLDKSSLGLPIGRAMKNLICYHLGTVLFGSFIIALIKLARSILAYIDRTLRARNNKVVKYVLLCLACCLWCFEKFMKFVNRNAYIMTAIHGYSFCKAAWAAFQVRTVE